jgi:Uma2 family endonuclease
MPDDERGRWNDRMSNRSLFLALQKLAPAGWHVAKEEALAVGPGCKWEPDAVVLRAELEFDATRDATAADCGLVAVVADASLARDRSEKRAGCARAGIPAYWIVNLVDGQVEVHSNPDPAAGRYLEQASHRQGALIPVVVDASEVGRVAAADLLP